MTIRVRIGAEERDFTDPNISWIHEQIRRRRDDREPVCVQVTVDEGDIHLILMTPDCPRVLGGGQLTTRASELVELWNKRHLNEKDFTSGNLIAFLQQIAH
jgi:hypothetical protein